ncbi:hypothetical protein [Enterovibrio nigricans]|uniref:Uncharacterized protein n=1 Tax=Enterovibrio nigricans DSM 22720 TaxID=1121868 RepID=A0A1T4V753_9GAMM|nr:hypothetical protein [Enterovibrio nigricans]PKF49398.1 hypothetical protein AT251_19205 [Enterovibrio nigricans]SKA60381.1 hypothetical protein SAMN02745132_03297 [Enterovibrio nigricans DSM 22720]
MALTRPELDRALGTLTKAERSHLNREQVKANHRSNMSRKKYIKWRRDVITEYRERKAKELLNEQ